MFISPHFMGNGDKLVHNRYAFDVKSGTHLVHIWYILAKYWFWQHWFCSILGTILVFYSSSILCSILGFILGSIFGLNIGSIFGFNIVHNIVFPYFIQYFVLKLHANRFILSPEYIPEYSGICPEVSQYVGENPGSMNPTTRS